MYDGASTNPGVEPLPAVTLTPETQQMVADAMAATGYATADDLVRDAVRVLPSPAGAAVPPDGMPVDTMPDDEFDGRLDAAMDESERDEGCRGVRSGPNWPLTSA